MATADGYVLPKPGVPKTLGILNVIFGVLMLLLGMCMVGLMAALPTLMDFGEKSIKEVQAKVEAQQKEQLKGLDERQKAAKTDEEKKAIEQERASTIANTPKVNTVDFNQIKDMMSDPTIKGHTFAQYGAFLILGLVLMISGIGLIRLTGWGRTLAITWALFWILHLILLTSYEAVVVYPVQKANSEKMLAKMEADIAADKAAPGAAESIRMARAMSGSGVAYARMAGWAVSLSIYPVILLILLNTAGARAAIPSRRPEGFDNLPTGSLP